MERNSLGDLDKLMILKGYQLTTNLINKNQCQFINKEIMQIADSLSDGVTKAYVNLKYLLGFLSIEQKLTRKELKISKMYELKILELILQILSSQKEEMSSYEITKFVEILDKIDSKNTEKMMKYYEQVSQIQSEKVKIKNKNQKFIFPMFDLCFRKNIPIEALFKEYLDMYVIGYNNKNKLDVENLLKNLYLLNCYLTNLEDKDQQILDKYIIEEEIEDIYQILLEYLDSNLANRQKLSVALFKDFRKIEFEHFIDLRLKVLDSFDNYLGMYSIPMQNQLIFYVFNQDFDIEVELEHKVIEFIVNRDNSELNLWKFIKAYCQYIDKEVDLTNFVCKILTRSLQMDSDSALRSLPPSDEIFEGQHIKNILLKTNYCIDYTIELASNMNNYEVDVFTGKILKHEKLFIEKFEDFVKKNLTNNIYSKNFENIQSGDNSCTNDSEFTDNRGQSDFNLKTDQILKLRTAYDFLKIESRFLLSFYMSY